MKNRSFRSSRTFLVLMAACSFLVGAVAMATIQRSPVLIQSYLLAPKDGPGELEVSVVGLSESELQRGVQVSLGKFQRYWITSLSEQDTARFANLELGEWVLRFYIEGRGELSVRDVLVEGSGLSTTVVDLSE